MIDIKRIAGAQYIGAVPDVLVIAPMKRLGDNMVQCLGCNSTIHAVNPDSAICPICASKQITRPGDGK